MHMPGGEPRGADGLKRTENKAARAKIKAVKWLITTHYERTQKA